MTPRFLAAGLPVLLACSSTTAPATLNVPLTATVNGASWSATTLRGDTVGDMATTPPTFELGGMDSVGTKRTTLGVDIRTLTDTGTFAIGGFFAPAQGIYAVLSPPDDTYPQSSAYQTDGNHVGSIHVAALDTTAHFVEGTFEFQAVFGSQTVTVTGGRFRGHYIKE